MSEKFFAPRGQSKEVFGSRGQLSKEIETKEEKNELIAKKKKVQEWLTKMDLDVIYHNMFDKNLSSFREDYNRYLVCRVNSKEKLNHILNEAKNLGYVCEKGPIRPNFYGGPSANNYFSMFKDENEININTKNYYFRIDLESVEI